MTITWLGHSCFLLESGGFRVILDPYHNVRGLTDISGEVDACYCSHTHYDHAYTEKLRISSGKANPFSVQELETFHDGHHGKFRGNNTVRRFTAEGISVVHLGDLGHMLSPEQTAALTPCDVLLIPIGGVYTINAGKAKEVADALSPTVVVPMHYRDRVHGLMELAQVDKFTELYPPEAVRQYPGNVLEVQKDMPPHVAVLAFPES